MSARTDPWHFPRADLAQSYLRSFDLGLTSARGLFARRRMGKSEFLKHDLLPAAMHDGYVAAYTNLWDSTDHPGQALATAILLATQPKGLGKFWTDLKPPIRRLKGGELPLGVEGSIELDESGGPAHHRNSAENAYFYGLLPIRISQLPLKLLPFTPQ